MAQQRRPSGHVKRRWDKGAQNSIQAAETVAQAYIMGAPYPGPPAPASSSAMIVSMASRSDGGTVAAMASFVCFTLTSVPVRLRLPEPTPAGIRVVPRVAATPAIVEADSAVRHRPRGLYKLLPSASSSQQNGPYRFQRRLTATAGPVWAS